MSTRGVAPRRAWRSSSHPALLSQRHLGTMMKALGSLERVATCPNKMGNWLVVSTPLKNISQLGWLFPIYGKIKNVPNHQPGNSRAVYFSEGQWHSSSEGWGPTDPTVTGCYSALLSGQYHQPKPGDRFSLHQEFWTPFGSLRFGTHPNFPSIQERFDRSISPAAIQASLICLIAPCTRPSRKSCRRQLPGHHYRWERGWLSPSRSLLERNVVSVQRRNGSNWGSSLQWTSMKHNTFAWAKKHHHLCEPPAPPISRAVYNPTVLPLKLTVTDPIRQVSRAHAVLDPASELGIGNVAILRLVQISAWGALLRSHLGIT